MLIYLSAANVMPSILFYNLCSTHEEKLKSKNMKAYMGLYENYNAIVDFFHF